MMKRYLFILVLALFSFAVNATVVDENTAVFTAGIFLKNKTGNRGLSVASVQAVTANGRTAYYIVNFSPEGWVLVAADDAVTPFIAFSPESSYSVQEMPEACEWWMQNRAEEIASIEEGAERDAQWDAPLGASTRADDDIEPLVAVNWNQGKPYNQFCPSDAGGTSLVGCVAVAMAQAMSVARYPERAVGEYSYKSENYGSIYINFDNEAAYDWNKIVSGADSKVWVAHLLYHCGVSLKMDYGTSGSGTQTAYIAGALVRNFSYPSSVKYYYRDSYAGDWAKLIYTELSEGRAVCYSGVDLKKGYGHCFNLDGYASGMFHVNWGWGGANNGYFALDGLKDATMNMDYTDQQGVIVGIRPPSDAPSDITLSSTKVAAEEPAGTYVADVQVESEAINPTYTYTVTGKYNIVTRKYKSTPFTVMDGVLYTTEKLNRADGEKYVRITATNKKNKKSVTREFNIEITDATGIAVSGLQSDDVRYDKTNHCIEWNSDASRTSVPYCLYTQNGKLVKQGICENSIEVSGCNDGCYILVLQMSGSTKTRKLIIRR